MVKESHIALDELKGVWRSQGYNKILDISANGFVMYDYCKVSCIEVKRGSLSDLGDLYDRFEQPQENQISMYDKGGVTRYTCVKQACLPELCKKGGTGKTEDPEYNFEVFWHYFDENYAFFELRKVDWNQVYETYRPQVTSKSTDDELLEIFSEIFSSLNDDHVSLTVVDRFIYSGKPPALWAQWLHEFDFEGLIEFGRKKKYMMINNTHTRKLLELGRKKLYTVIRNNFLNGVCKAAANNLLVWGKIEPNIGYLNIFRMHGYAGPEAPPNEQLAALEKAMDQVMEDFRDVEAVIIDIRFNPGGFDPASLLIASRFVNKKCLAFTKKAVHGDTFTKTQEIYVYPEGEFQFTGPTALLTSEATESAAEILTLSMMGNPHVIRVGGSTQGVLSDVLSRQLPNGWEVGLSNEIYEAIDGNVYEKTGIPVHVEVPVFIPTYFYSGLKLAVNKAVSLLKDELIDSGKLSRFSLDEFIMITMEAYNLPGLAACIVKNNRIVWSKGYGWANIEQQIPMSPDTLMNIGSVSKTITATAIMRLWEEGKFQLNDDINSALPFSVKNPFHPNEAITFRQLLTHTSSISDARARYEKSYSCGDPKMPLRTWIEEYLTPGGAHYNKEENFHSWKPGERYDYSNIGFGLLGYLVEAISGSSFGDYCKSNIFEPFGMEETSWYLADLDVSKHAVPYTYTSNGEIRGRLLQEGDEVKGAQEREGYIPNCLYSFPNFPDGLLRTSVHQLAHFLIAYINNGSYKDRRLLQEDTIQEIFKSQLDKSLVPSRVEIHGLTWYAQRLDDRNLVWGHSGGDPGITTQMLFSPTTVVGVIVFTNTGGGYGLMDIAKRLFQEAAIL